MSDTISKLKSEAVEYAILLDIVKKYVPRTVWQFARELAMEQVINIPDRKMELTVVFADIYGFTRIAQYQEPKEVIVGLNTVFDIANEAVYKYGGDIDKYIGDAFFAVFKEPGDAVDSMREIQESLRILNKRRVQRGEPRFLMRIGIHTGPVIRGNVGGGARYDNTLIGDTVNIASRLEELAPPGGILISEQTRAKANISFPDVPPMEVTLRGRDRMIKAVTLVTSPETA